MDIRKGAKYPAGSLSNFTPYVFEVDGVTCNSMEGFLQSLKFSNPDMQVYICSLVGAKAKLSGSKKMWKKRQQLYWKGVVYDRSGDEYQTLLDKAFTCLSKNTKFTNTLSATNNANLTHSLGKKNKRDTVLTQQEFCSRLTKLRDNGGL